MSRRVIGINGDIGSGKDTLFSLLPPGTVRLAFGDALKAEVAEFLGKHDVSQVIQFLAQHKCSLEHLIAILGETWGCLVEHREYPFLRTILENEGGKVACDSFVAKHRSLRVSAERWGGRLMLAERGTIEHLMHDRDQKEQFRTLLKWWGTEYRRLQFRDDYWVNILCERMASLPSDTLFAITDPRFPNEFEFVQKECGGLLLRIERDGTEGTRNHASDTSWVGWPFDLILENNGTIGDLADTVPDILYRLDRKLSGNPYVTSNTVHHKMKDGSVLPIEHLGRSYLNSAPYEMSSVSTLNDIPSNF